MDKRATWLVVAALVFLGLAAAADTFRDDSQTERPPQAAREPTATQRSADSSPAALPPLSGPGLSGVLYYTDSNCRLRALEVPSLRDSDAPGWGECRFSLSPTGRAVEPDGTAWHPRRQAWATDLGGERIVVTRGPTEVLLPGSAPAYRPDGRLTFAFGGAVRALLPDCLRSGRTAVFLDPAGVQACSRVLIDRRALRRAANRHPNVPDVRGVIRTVRVRQLAWLDARRAVLVLVVAVRSVEEFDVTAIFEGGRLVAHLAAFQEVDRLWASPDGGFFALGGRTLEIYDRDGRSRPLPPLAEPGAVAWSPDESWLAVATRASVYVFRTRGQAIRLGRIPLEAHDLAWRPAGETEP